VQDASLVTHRERARPAWLRNSPNGWWFAVAAVCFGAFMGQLDASIITLTYEPVRVAFGVSLPAVGWVSLAYLITVAALLVTLGQLSDRYGRKRLYLWGFFVFTIASAGCAVSPNLAVLVGCRVVQGLGAALLQANSVALVGMSAPAHRRRAALGVQAAAQALGLALGPTLGGVLVDGLGWRWVYAVNIPVGIVALIAGRYLLPRTRRPVEPAGGSRGAETAAAGAVDIAAAVALAITLTGTMLALSAATEWRLAPGAWTLLIAITLAAAGLLFARLHRRGSRSVVAGTLRAAGVLPGLLTALCSYALLFGPLVLLPVMLTLKGVSASRVGLLLLPLPVAFAIAATLSDRVLPRAWAHQPRVACGSLIAGAGVLALLCGAGSTAALAVSIAVIGLGVGIVNPANNAAVLESAPSHAAATVGGLVNTARAVGTALAVSLVTLAAAAGSGSYRSVASFAGLALLGIWLVLLLSAAPAAVGRRVRCRDGAR